MSIHQISIPIEKNTLKTVNFRKKDLKLKFGRKKLQVKWEIILFSFILSFYFV